MRSIKLPSWIERALGLEPQPVPPFVFAADASSLRLACFAREGARSRLSFVDEVRFSEVVYQTGPLGGPVAKPEELSASIAELVARSQERIREAVLVVPDEWMRTAFAQLNELPRPGKARREVLEWKLKQLVPFRVEELRVRGEEVPSPEQSAEGAKRVLLAFAVEQLLEDLEAAFAANDVRIGWITNETLATIAAVRTPERTSDDTLDGVVLVRPQSYSVAIRSQSRPVLLRFKALEPAIDPEATLRLARRELLLTADFLAESFPGRRLERVFLLASDYSVAWAEMIREAVGAEVEELDSGSFGELEWTGATMPWVELAPMVAASFQSTE